MPDPAIAAVEILGVYAIELAHTLREVGFGGFDQQVIVHTAKINTLGARAEDFFLVRADDNWLSNAKVVLKIETDLLQALT